MRPFPALTISDSNPGAGFFKWRIRTLIDQGGGFMSAAEVKFLKTAGDAAQPGSGVAHGSTSSGGAPADAFDGNAATIFATATSGGSNYIEFDFDLPWTITEIYYQARNDGFGPTQSPRHLVVEAWNGTTWAEQGNIFGIPYFAAGEIKRLAVSPVIDDPGANSRRYWRLVPLTNFGSTDYAEIEVEFIDYLDVNQGIHFNTFVGDAALGGGLDGVVTGDNYILFSGAPLKKAAVDFFKKRDIRKVRLTARSTNLTQSLKSGRLDWSDDNVTWHEFLTFHDAGSTPAANAQRLYVRGVPLLATPAPSISGTISTYGNVLTLDVGYFENGPDTYSVQWRRGGVNIAGETNLTYTTVLADNNQDIDATVIAHSTVGDSATATAATVHIGAPGSTAFNWTDPNVLTAHRYWRLLWGTVQSGTLATIAELYMRNTAGTLLTGTWTAWNSANGAASSVADGSGSTFWGDDGSSALLNRWIKLDLGAGNSAIVDKIEMTPRTSFSSQTPIDFYLQYSDDNATWFDATRFRGCGNWGSGVAKNFRVRPYIVQFYLDDPANGSFTTVAEFECLTGAGVDLTTPPANSDDRGRPLGTHDGNDASSGFNDVLSDYTGNAGNPSLTEWRFSAIPDCFGVSARARPSFSSQCLHSMKVKCSRDGINYNLVYQVPAQAGWSSNERRSWTF